MSSMLYIQVTLANIGKYFASFEPGRVLDSLDELYKGVVKGFRAFPLDFPGTDLHTGLQVITSLIGTSVWSWKYTFTVS